MKKEILRKCLATNKMFDKRNLLRIVYNKEGEIFVDLTLKANGRGAYLSKNKEAIELCIKKRLLDKAFNTAVDDSVYESLRGYIDE